MLPLLVNTQASVIASCAKALLQGSNEGILVKEYILPKLSLPSLYKPIPELDALYGGTEDMADDWLHEVNSDDEYGPHNGLVEPHSNSAIGETHSLHLHAQLLSSAA